jgi:16S rRNA (uracil1498-N3)-methyltransferase
VRNPRIHTEQPLTAGRTVTLGEQAAHYIGRVLRLPAGASITLFNGDGHDYAATIDTIDKRSVAVTVASATLNETESPLAIHLGIAISKGERMDFVMQKATELGVTAITPLLSERVEVRLAGERAEKRWQHWHGVIVSACEQCGRARLPQLGAVSSLSQWVDSVQAERKFVLHHRSNQSLESGAEPNSVALLIGPEGGLSAQEIGTAERAGFDALTLGPRVLRTETAPLTALAVLQYCWGDLQPR